MPAREGQPFEPVGAANHLKTAGRQHPAERHAQFQIVFNQEDIHVRGISRFVVKEGQATGPRPEGVVGVSSATHAPRAMEKMVPQARWRVIV
ncbi:hypothetical protein FQZ97_910600 [compost metagenome]